MTVNVVMVLAVFLLMTSGGAAAVGEDVVEILLLDGYSAQPIASTGVDVYSDNGIRCIKAPCNTGGQSWQGETDASGVVRLPSRIVNKVTNVSAAGYAGAELSRDGQRRTGRLQLELDPRAKTEPEHIEQAARRFKIVDANSGQPLKRTTLWVVRSSSCVPPGCKDFSYSGPTNSLGNVYLPIFKIKIEDSWIAVTGYANQKFASIAGDNTMRMRRR